MPARSVCLVTLSLSEAGPGRFGRQVSVTDIYHTIPYHYQVVAAVDVTAPGVPCYAAVRYTASNPCSPHPSYARGNDVLPCAHGTMPNP